MKYSDWIYYAGIGSRETPEDVLKLFRSIAKHLAKKGLVLRSGGADGADLAFEIGCDAGKGMKEIFLPWQKFNGSNSVLVVEPNGKAWDLSAQFHPYWHNLKRGAKLLHSRNAHQVLGCDLETPSKFIICWTKAGKNAGGTAQALRLAEYYNIPVCNVGHLESVDEMKQMIKEFIKDKVGETNGVE